MRDQDQKALNPYLAGRLEWNERYGGFVREARAWRAVAVLSLALASIGFGYALYLSRGSRIIPYIVEVDRLGSPVAVGVPERIEYADRRVVRAILANFVASFRSVTPDAVVQKKYIDRTYALLRASDPSTEKINAWFRSNSPFEAAKRVTVSVEVSNIVSLSERSWQIDWTEFERDRRGRETGSRRYRGIATVTLTEPQDEAVIRLNPIGLYVRDFDWTAQL
ncbi:conjugal transfer protein TrbF [Allorhizobium sp. NPDC080224]|uniref:conjugal transfer protein TrbF n=1 Tax=Allorhizobium sp. NPDC080224 TaxID=3390547 RepID=UPI003D068F29